MRLWIAMACALSLGGCATGQINTGRLPVEPGAASRGPDGAPLRERQIDLAAILKSELEQRGVVIVEADRPRANATPPPIGARAIQRGSAASPPVIYLGSDKLAGLDILIAATDQAGPDARQIRNDVVNAWMAASTANCSVYVQSLRGGQVGSRLFFDFLSGGFAAASSLATPEGSAKILAALSAFSTAEGSSVDRNIFAEQGAELVADAIMQLRAESRTRIHTRLNQSYDQYPLGMALADLYEFHTDCTMLRGFSRMRTAVLAREQTVQAIRAAAAGVLRENGTPEQMMAVIAALQDGARPTTPTPIVEAQADMGDVARLHSNGAACLDAVKLIVQSDPAKTVDAAIGEAAAADPACVAKEKEWASRYLRLVSTREGERATAATAVDAAQGKVVTATALLAAADAASQAAASDALQAAKEERTRALQALTAAVEKAADDYDTANLNARNLALQLLRDWDPARGLDEVVGALRAVGGPELVKDTPGHGDPVFMLAIAAAEQLKLQNANASSEAAARQALHAAKGYMGLT